MSEYKGEKNRKKILPVFVCACVYLNAPEKIEMHKKKFLFEIYFLLFFSKVCKNIDNNQKKFQYSRATTTSLSLSTLFSSINVVKFYYIIITGLCKFPKWWFMIQKKKNPETMFKTTDWIQQIIGSNTNTIYLRN